MQPRLDCHGTISAIISKQISKPNRNKWRHPERLLKKGELFVAMHIQYHRGASGEVSLIYRQEGRVTITQEFPEHLMNETMIGSFYHKSYMDLVGSSCIKMSILFQL